MPPRNMHHRFHREMAKSEYFRMLLPYLQHLTEDQTLNLPSDYFRAHASELDVAFRLFHERYIATAITAESPSDQNLFDQLRRKQHPQDVLDEFRRSREKKNTSSDK